MRDRDNRASFLEKLAALGVNAAISSVATSITADSTDEEKAAAIPKLKFIALSDAAVMQALGFATTAILAYQYDAYTLAIATGKTPGQAKEQAKAIPEIQQIAWQLMNARAANMQGVAIEGTPLKVEFKTVAEIKALNAAGEGDPDFTPYPLTDPDAADDDPYIIFTIPPGQPGQDGAPGQPGQDGQQGPQGIPGPPGADGAPCTDCNGPVISGPGGGGTGGSGGSGPDGTPNPDGQDTTVYLPNCNDPIINFPYCSDSFTFENADLRAAITAVAQGSGHFDPDTDDLISAVLDFHGAAYAGVVTVTVEAAPVSVSGENYALVLNLTDALDKKQNVPHTIEDFGVPDVLMVRGYHYAGSLGVAMQPVGNPISLNGIMSQYPILGGANCHTPPDETDPAWLKVCLLSFVKHHHAPVPCDQPALPDGQSYFVVGDTATFPTEPLQADWGHGAYNAGTQEIYNTPYGYKVRYNTYGFEEGKTYRVVITGEAYNGGNMGWSLYYGDNADNNFIAASTGHNEPRHDNYGQYVFDLGTITIPAGFGVTRCGIFAIRIYQAEALKDVTLTGE